MKRKIAELKEKRAVGQVISSGINVYVVVEETVTGVDVMCLKGTVVEGPEAVYPVDADVEVTLLDATEWKGKFLSRWQEIAKRYPKIDEGG